MICICTGLAHHAYRLINIKRLLLNKYPDKLRNYHCWMRIVDLNHSMVMKLVQIVLTLLLFSENQMCSVRYEEILLIYPKEISGHIRVIGIQEKSEIILGLCFIEVNSLFYKFFIYRLYIKQPELVDTGSVSDDIHVVKARHYFLSAKINIKSRICLLKPTVFLYPVILLFNLEIILKHLLKKSKMIVESDSLPGKSESCYRIKEACGKPSETAVSQRRLRLILFDLGKIFAVFCQYIFYPVIDTKINKIIGKKFSDQKLHRDVVYFFLTVIKFRNIHQTARHFQKHIISFTICAVF